ncbi:MAG: VWA domain-containing protein [Nanoarchaeota archaeon]|nr:VWA domain-containing protein [Nanoarchaeota archaeon]
MALESTLLTLSKYLSDPTGLYALATLIPLIIIYLIKPKPTKRVIPALMFFLRDTGKSPIKSLFEHFFKDPLLILQIIILIVASLAIAQPFTEVQRTISGDEIVLIIDGSASSQTMYDKGKGMTRFDEELDIARGLVGRKNTIILAGSTPEIVAEEVSGDDALNALRTLKPKDTPTNIYDAIIVAGNYLHGSGSAFVISDFIQTEEGLDIDTAKSLLETRGIKVFFKKVFKKAKNIGIVSIDVKEESTILLVKNFNEEAADVTVRAGSFEESVSIGPKSTEIMSFTTPQTTTKVELIIPSGKDDFAADNSAYVTFPQGKAIKVLLLSNNPSKYLTTALSVMKYVELTTVAPPRSVDITNYHVIITQNLEGSLLLPGVMRDIKKKVEQGGSLVMMAQDGLFQIDFTGMLPVEYNSLRGDADVRTVMDTKFTKDVNFGHVGRHFDTELKAGIALAETTEGVPMLVLNKWGNGNIVYYGIIDDNSSFKMDMYYPIFWKRMLDFLTEQKDINNINLKTGDVKYLDSEVLVKLPNNKKITTNRLPLEYVGRYVQGDEEFVASLASEMESDINGETVETKTELVQETDFMEKRKIDLTIWFVIACFALIFLELLFIKIRGDV